MEDGYRQSILKWSGNKVPYGTAFVKKSAWERNEGYPDITLLPVLVGYFGVTVDTLLETDITSRDEKIEQYYREYERLNQIGDSRCVKTAQEAYYLSRYNKEAYIRQKQQNRLSLFEMLFDKLSLEGEDATPEERIAAEETRLRVLEVLFSEKDRHLLAIHTVVSYLNMAETFWALGCTDRVLDILDLVWHWYKSAGDGIFERDSSGKVLLETPLFDTVARKWVDR